MHLRVQATLNGAQDQSSASYVEPYFWFIAGIDIHYQRPNRNVMSSSHRSRSMYLNNNNDWSGNTDWGGTGRIPPSARSHAQGRMASLLGEDNNTFEPQNGVPSAFKWDSKRYEEEISRESEKVCDREGVLGKSRRDRLIKEI
jgi:hypothetical protein